MTDANAIRVFSESKGGMLYYVFLLDLIYLGNTCLFLAWARHRTTRWHPRCLKRCFDGETRPGIAAGTVALSIG